MIFDILFIVAIFATFIVQAIVHSKYKKYAKVDNMLGLTGEEVAKQILESRGISGINIVPIEGELTDCGHIIEGNVEIHGRLSDREARLNACIVVVFFDGIEFIAINKYGVIGERCTDSEIVSEVIGQGDTEAD